MNPVACGGGEGAKRALAPGIQLRGVIQLNEKNIIVQKITQLFVQS